MRACFGGKIPSRKIRRRSVNVRGSVTPLLVRSRLSGSIGGTIFFRNRSAIIRATPAVYVDKEPTNDVNELLNGGSNDDFSTRIDARFRYISIRFVFGVAERFCCFRWRANRKNDCTPLSCVCTVVACNNAPRSANRLYGLGGGRSVGRRVEYGRVRASLMECNSNVSVSSSTEVAVWCVYNNNNNNSNSVGATKRLNSVADEIVKL